MNTTNAIPELDQRGLRQFGFVSGSIVAIVFGVLLPLLHGRSSRLWPWAVLVALVGLGLVAPNALKPIYIIWMRFGLLVSRITTPLILGIIFFILITPLALIKRFFGRDAMTRNFDGSAPSYRIKSVQKEAKNLERPF